MKKKKRRWRKEEGRGGKKRAVGMGGGSRVARLTEIPTANEFLLLYKRDKKDDHYCMSNQAQVFFVSRVVAIWHPAMPSGNAGGFLAKKKRGEREREKMGLPSFLPLP